MTDVTCLWTVKEKIRLPISHREIWHPVLTRKNTFTNTGLTLLASAIQGGYTPPNYLIIESNYTTLVNPQNAGDQVAVLTSQINQIGDSSIVLSIGLPNQEVAAFTSVAAVMGGYQYTLSAPLTYNHAAGDYCTRQVYATDTITNIANEQQYDPTNAATFRMQSVAGYSQGPGNWTTQYYFPANTALAYISHIGLSDTQIVGAGNLHNHVILGIDHTGNVSDIEIDGSLTLTNS